MTRLLIRSKNVTLSGLLKGASTGFSFTQAFLFLSNIDTCISAHPLEGTVERRKNFDYRVKLCPRTSSKAPPLGEVFAELTRNSGTTSRGIQRDPTAFTRSAFIYKNRSAV